MISFKVPKSIKIIVHLRQFCLTAIPLTVFNSQILPCLQYCAIIWASTYFIHILPILRRQKKQFTMCTFLPAL